MGQVWELGDAALCIHPGGEPLVGQAAVMQSWMEILSGSAPPSIRVQVQTRMSAPNLCVHVVEEFIRAGGRPDAATNRVLATNVYVRGADGWRLRLHHASLPLVSPRSQASTERKLH